MAAESLSVILDSGDESIYSIRSKAPGPDGSLPLTDDMLRHWPSGDLFGLTQNAGMGWDPQQMRLEVILPARVSAELVMPPACEGGRIEVLESSARIPDRQGRRLELRGAGRYLFGVR